MKNIWKIFTQDMKNLVTHPFVLIIAIGLCAIPSLYAWFNIYSNWDPYANTGNIKIAVTNLDEDYKTDDGTIENMGNEVVEELKQKDSIGWVFLDSQEEALEGLNRGDYYAAVVIEKNFTKGMYNVFREETSDSSIVYYENEKKNAIGTKITDSAISSLKTSINEKFIDVVVNMIFEKTNSLSEELDDMDTFTYFEEKLTELNSNLIKYSSMINTFTKGNAALSAVIAETSGNIPGLQDNLKDGQSNFESAQENLSKTQTSLNDFSSNVDQTMGTINTAINQISTDITNANLGESAQDTADSLNQTTTDTAELIKQLNSLYAQLAKSVTDSDENDEAKQQMEAILETINDIGKSASGIQSEIAGLISDVASSNNTETLQKYIENLQKIVSNGEKILTDLNTIYENSGVAEQYPEIAQLISDIGDTLGDISKALGDISNGTDIDKTLASLKSIAEQTVTLLGQLNELANHMTVLGEIAQNQLGSIRTEISDLLQTVNNVKTALDSIDLSKLKVNTTITADAVNAATTNLTRILGNCSDAVNNMQSMYKNTLVPQMNGLIDSMENMLLNVTELLDNLNNTMGDMTTIFNGIETTVSSTNDSLEQIKVVIDQISEKLTNLLDRLDAVGEDEKVQAFLTFLQGDPESYGEFFSEPVSVTTEEVYPIKTYGCGMTPFYTILALWVGGTILVALVKVKAEPVGLTNVKSYQLYFGRYLLFFVLGQVQTAIVVLGDIYLLHCQVLYPGLFWLTASVASLTFTLFIYSLTISFGDVGKALAVVIMVIQIAGSGGSFPIELLPAVYRNIYIFFPFPYAINAMRETIGGMYGSTYTVKMLELLVFVVVSLMIGLVIRIPFVKVSHFMEERMEETEMM